MTERTATLFGKSPLRQQTVVFGPELSPDCNTSFRQTCCTRSKSSHQAGSPCSPSHRSHRPDAPASSMSINDMCPPWSSFTPMHRGRGSQSTDQCRDVGGRSWKTIAPPPPPVVGFNCAHSSTPGFNTCQAGSPSPACGRVEHRWSCRCSPGRGCHSRHDQLVNLLPFLSTTTLYKGPEQLLGYTGRAGATRSLPPLPTTRRMGSVGRPHHRKGLWSAERFSTLRHLAGFRNPAASRYAMSDEKAFPHAHISRRHRQRAV